MDTQNSYVVSDQKPIAVIGLNDVVVVNTDEAILIADKSSGTNIQNMYYNLKSEVSNDKPWGAFYEIKKGKNFAIKKLKIAPFQRTSLQLHHNRSEYLIVIEGSAAVIVGDESYTLNPGDSVHVLQSAVHRITNNGLEELVIVEVQVGSPISENYIIRIQDDYGRLS
ncbi:MAG: cupin domain-containing protein [Candidatus Midichloria sp.]|nr:cupin domain-containing protein [Candidatus Midichloria sp.]